ncbi:hypothetical protein BH11MYX2_BH11MYX2_21270 [soil metagenome]
MKTTIALALALTGCATAAQSAHTLAPGKTEVTVSGSRNTLSGQSDDAVALYGGQVMVRRGVAENADVGFSVTRTPGSGQSLWGLAVDPKFRFTAAGAQTTISLGVPVALFFADQPSIKMSDTSDGQDELDYGGVMASPTLYVGQAVSPTAELLIAPRLYLIKPGEGTFSDTDLRLYFGGSIGVRLTDPKRHWAVTPEIAFTHLNAENGADSQTLLTVGVGLSVGN